MDFMFRAILLIGILVRVAQAQDNIIVEKTIDVSFHPEEMSLTCRMGTNGHSYISLNAPTLEKALNANVQLTQTTKPHLHLTSAFFSASSKCQETNMELTKFIVASGDNLKAQFKLSLVETTRTSFGVTYRVLREAFLLEFNDKLKFSNSGSILLEKK